MKTTSQPPAAGQAAHFTAGPISFNGHLHTCTILGPAGLSLFLQSRAGESALIEQAAFIVRACNGYAPLVEALEMLVGDNASHSLCRHKGADVMGRVMGTWSEAAEAQARAALALAKGVQS